MPPGNGNHGHQEPVAEAARRRDGGDRARAEVLLDQEGHEVAEGDPRQHARDADGLEMLNRG